MATYAPTELEAFVRQRAPEISRDILAVARQARNEADLVAEVEKLLEHFAKNFDVGLRLERERTLVNGRADAVYNRFVIEYEPPGSLRASNLYTHNKHAIEQVQQYMEGLERLDRHKRERLAGVVLDGSFYIFVRFRDTHWRVDDPLPVDPQSTETFLRYLLSLSTELALTPENLMRDFGENSNAARRVVPALYAALLGTENPKVRTLFRQWQRQFHEVTGYDAVAGQLEAAALARLYAVTDRSIDLERLFFSVHTYYATFIKLLALQVAHYYLMPKVGTGLAAVASMPSDRLAKYLREMERGGIFAELGIRNFLEGDFFGWYLDIWDEALDGALRRLTGELANYSLVTLDVDPEETRDLLKHLYQNLMPKKLRHALGEYYTPDWLAERLLNQLGYEGDPKQRLLDPACGSGTFLVLTIKRVREYAKEKMLPEARVLEQVLQNVVGFDLNPLAVISARTNYLLALGDLLPHRTGEISIPVYLADSILTPSETGGDLFSRGSYNFNTAVGQFAIPRSLVDARYIDQLAGLLEECVLSGLKEEQFRERLLKTFPLNAERDEDDIGHAMALYGQLADLERQGIDGIWARIIKNAFAPLFQGRFNYVAGNPPWVNWESLPGDYRQETKALWVYHNLFPHGGMDTILGKGKKDISMLMTFVAADKYLEDRGKLGFVITQSVFKTSGAGQGFRRFVLGSRTPVGVLAVDDLVDLQPFEGATNRTAVVVLQRGRVTRYPVAYTMWHKTARGRRVPENATLDEVLEMSSTSQLLAQPIDLGDATAPWITGRRRALQAVRTVIGKAAYRGYEGSNTGGANGVYWLEVVARRPDGLVVVSNLTAGAKRLVEDVQAAIETEVLYPLLRGRDVCRWRAVAAACILMAQDPVRRSGVNEQEFVVNFPRAYAYLKRFEGVLHERKDRGTQGIIAKGGPFYSFFGVGDYTMAPHKVVWREVSHELDAAVIGLGDADVAGGKPVIPDHTLILIPCETGREAHFVCAALNSAPSRFIVKNYIVLHPDPHVLQRVRIPQYDRTDAVHERLAELSVQAHQTMGGGDPDRVREIEAEIDRAAAELWGMKTDELKEIQESLAELA